MSAVLPAGALVVGAGALFGPWLGIVTVLMGQVAGLTLNWRLCRGVLRPRMQRWLEGRQRGSRLRWLLQQPAELRLLLLLQLAAIPMALVDVACAIGPTPLHPYRLARLVLVPRFSLMLLAGSLGAEATRGSLSPLTLAARIMALLATAAALLLPARGLRQGLLHGSVPRTAADPVAEPPDSADVSQGEPLRFVPLSEGFQRRNGVADALLSHWTLVGGTGSWLEAHLMARLGRAQGLPNLLGCGISEQEVWDLVQQVAPETPLLVLLCDSIAADRGCGLITRLRRQRPGTQILLLVQDERWLSPETLRECEAQAIAAVVSFGSGTLIRALQALQRGERFLDPRLRQRLQLQTSLVLSAREQQILEGLARGLTNRAIAAQCGIAPSTARDQVSQLCQRLSASNRTQLLNRAISLGLIQPGD